MNLSLSVIFRSLNRKLSSSQVAEEVEGLNRNICSFDCALQQRPKVLDAIRVNHVVFHVGLGMIHELMRVFGVKPLV